MAPEWVRRTVADACSAINYGLTASASDVPGGPQFLRITDIVSGHVNWNTVPYVGSDCDFPKYQLRHGDIVLARTGASTGASAYVIHPPRAVFASYLVRLRTNPNFDSRFLAYYLKSPMFLNFLRGVLGDKSAQPNASASTMTGAPLIAPKDVAVQRAIAHILGTLDDKIELNRRMNETLEAMAQALFKSWFVDFEPVRAKIAGRDTRLSPDVDALFPCQLNSSRLGDTPSGWPFVPLTDLIDVNPRRSSLSKGQRAPYLPMAAMPTKGHTPTSLANRPFGSGMRFTNGDTLLARITPCLENGKTAYVDFLKDDQIGWGSTEYIVLRPKAPLSSKFAYCLARSTRFRDFAIQNLTGTSGRQRVQPTALRQFWFPSPPRDVATAFGRLVRPFFAQASSLAGQSRTLAHIRDGLLPKLISGKLRPAQAEKAISAVL